MKTEDYTLITSAAVSQLDPEAFDDDESLSMEERQRLAGLDEEFQSLIAPEHRLDPEAVPVKRDLSQSPVPRTALVMGSAGVLVLFGLGVTWIAGVGRSRQPAVAEAPPVADSDVIAPSEADLYKGRLALTEQDRDQQPTPKPPVSTTPSRKQATPKPKTPAQPRPAPVAPRPAPAPVRPAPVRSVAPRPAPVARPAPAPPQVDPFDQWNRLAAIGSAAADVTDQPVQEVSAIDTATAPAVSNLELQSDFPATVIGDSPFDASPMSVGTAAAPVLAQTLPQAAAPIRADSSLSLAAESYSPGTQGILEQQAVEQGLTASGNHQVALGTSAAAEVSVPLYWEDSSSGGASRQRRFAVTLTQPLLATTGVPALPAGTTFITEAQVSGSSRIVDQTVVAVVYESADGRIHQEAITPGTIVVRGENNEPLRARRTQRSNLGDDLLLGAAGALGRVGELLNQGDVFSSSSSAAGSSASTTITRRGNTNVLAAALDGFFNPLVEQMQNRAEFQNQEDDSTILTVNEGQPVSVFVNGILEVSP